MKEKKDKKTENKERGKGVIRRNKRMAVRGKIEREEEREAAQGGRKGRGKKGRRAGKTR